MSKLSQFMAITVAGVGRIWLFSASLCVCINFRVFGVVVQYKRGVVGGAVSGSDDFVALLRCVLARDASTAPSHHVKTQKAIQI